MKKITVIVVVLLALSPLLRAEDKPAANNYTAARAHLVNEELRKAGIHDETVLAAMLKVERHLFVPEKYRSRAYEDIALPIDKWATISQPYMVALMTAGIRPEKGDKVLEIGTGTGYSAAVLAEIVDKVYTIEIEEKLAASAKERLKELGYKNISVRAGDGFFGWPKAAPFDGIIVTCAAEKIPPQLGKQLKVGGRMILPLGKIYSPQTLVVVTKTKAGQLITRPLAHVEFVPMRGKILEK